MRAACIGHRLNKYLEAAELYAGERHHGFRRGQIQDLVAAGVAKPQIGEVIQIKTAGVLEKYADASRHILVCNVWVKGSRRNSSHARPVSMHMLQQHSVCKPWSEWEGIFFTTISKGA